VKMLPEHAPTIEGYDIASYYESCLQLSGDLYHFLDAGPGRTGILIGDVAGHGVEAGMVMSATLKSFSVRSKGQSSPKAVLEAVNDDLHKDLRRGKFITAFYAVLEHATGRLTYSRAGHNPGLLITSEGLQQLMGTGLALGIADRAKFSASLTENEVMLPPMSLVLLYTDGLIEAMNPEKEEFGEERMCDLFMQYSYLPSVNIIEQLQAAVQAHLGGQAIADDMTLVLIKRVYA
jgi:sigma-B regulation protein RsbU (phosphoserine phosphatase)